MLWLFALVGLLMVVVIGLVVLGRETARLAVAARTAVFDMAQAVDFIADRLPADAQARLTHDDVRWILLADADHIEERSDPLGDGDGEDDGIPGFGPIVDEDAAVARILIVADASGRDLADEDVAAVLDGRSAYLRAIGAIGPEVDPSA